MVVEAHRTRARQAALSLQRLRAARANMLGAVLTSEVAVNAYNAKVDQRDKLIESYQNRVTAYNTKADTVKATKEGYEKQCENQRYDERDLNDLKRKK